MKNKKIFTLSAIIISLALQSVFILFFLKISAWNNFAGIKDKIEHTWSLSISMPRQYGNFTRNKNTAIFSLPSVNPENTVIPLSNDYVSIAIDNSIMMFSVYPGRASYRKHKTLYIKNADNISFDFAGDFFSVKSCSCFDCYFHNFSAEKNIFLLPSSPEVF